MFKANEIKLSDTKKNVVVIGTSNSIIDLGWCSSLSFNFDNECNVINLSLGGCTSLFVAYQIDHFLDILTQSDFIIVEPIVNDMSYLPNKMIDKDILFDSIEYLYRVLNSINVPSLSLLLPTQKRLGGYDYNPVYLKHVMESKKNNIFMVDLYPMFRRFNDLSFLDPGHIDLFFSWNLGNFIFDVISDVLSFNETNGLDAKTPKSIYKYVDPIGDDNELLIKENSRYQKRLTKSKELDLEHVGNCKLVGVMHWCDVNDACVNVKVSDSKDYWLLLKSKYLRLSSPGEEIQIYDNDTISLLSDNKGIAISELMFQWNKPPKDEASIKYSNYDLLNDYITQKFSVFVFNFLDGLKYRESNELSKEFLLIHRESNNSKLKAELKSKLTRKCRSNFNV